MANINIEFVRIVSVRVSAGWRGGGGGGAWWRALVAELLGSALLTSLGCMPAACQSGTGSHPALGAVTFGLVVALIVQCFDHASGALVNPAVTLAATVAGRLPGVFAVILAIVQVAGAAVGYSLLMALVPTPTLSGPGACLTLTHVSWPRALAAETLLTAALVLANCAAWDARNRLLLDSWPARIGIVVTALSLAGVGIFSTSFLFSVRRTLDGRSVRLSRILKCTES